MKHRVGLLIILTFTALLYVRIPTTYFCGYDDFNENNRAAFEERKEPLRLLTATHFNSYKYRPLSHTLHFITYWLGNGNPILFRIRNVICHLLNVLLVYGIGRLLFKKYSTSVISALLFGVHPLANQPVVAASFTIPAAHVAFLFALYCFLRSVQRQNLSLTWLFAALFSAWCSLLTYESSISVFGLMFTYVIIRVVIEREQLPSRRYLVVLIAGSMVFISSYFGLRKLFVNVAAQQAVPPVKVLVLSAAMYAGALLTPIDPVLANAWFKIPLPSEIHWTGFSWSLKIELAFLGTLVLALLIWIGVRIYRRLTRPILAVQLF